MIWNITPQRSGSELSPQAAVAPVPKWAEDEAAKFGFDQDLSITFPLSAIIGRGPPQTISTWIVEAIL